MGKMIILLVLGSYLIIGSIMRNNNNISNDSVQNVVDYYIKANAKHIASSGANLAVSNVFRNRFWRTGYNNINFSEGLIKVTLTDDAKLGVGGVRILSVGKYMGYQDSVIVDMNLSYYSKYLMFSNTIPSNGYYVTGDTMDGPFHTNSVLNISGKPVFKGRVTMGKGPMKLSSWYAPPAPEFWGGYEYGVDIPMQGNLNNLASAALVNGFKVNGKLWLTLNGNNTITFKTSATGKDSTIALNLLAPNGVIYATDDVRVKGKISGSLTIASKEKIWIDDDIGVVDDPRINPASKQMLGLCSEEEIMITDNSANNNNVEITAAMYTNSSLEAEHYSTRPAAGYLKLLGSLTQDTDGFTGAGVTKGGVKNGFNLNYKFDDRLFLSAPPSFPLTDRMQLLSWWE